MKNAKTVRDDRTSFKRLAQNSDPKSRRTSYNEWIKQVKKCFQMLSEFDNLFDPTDPTFIGTVSKKYADEALRHTIPLLNTLHVLGLRTTLWSVIQFAQCGHTIIFGDTTIRIIMHDGRPESFELRLSHPFYSAAIIRLVTALQRPPSPTV